MSDPQPAAKAEKADDSLPLDTEAGPPSTRVDDGSLPQRPKKRVRRPWTEDSPAEDLRNITFHAAEVTPAYRAWLRITQPKGTAQDPVVLDWDEEEAGSEQPAVAGDTESNSDSPGRAPP